MVTTRSLTLRTPRLVLQPMEEKDFDGMHALLTSQQIAKTFLLPDYPDVVAVRKTFARYMELSANPERFVYGTDFPLWDPRTEVPRFLKLKLTPEEMEQIAYKTALHILKED